jgi:hypothetical protein
MSRAWVWLLLLAAPAAGETLERALALHQAGRLEEALAAYRAVALSSAASDPASAATAHNNACVLLTDRGDFGAALVECRSAERVRRGLGDEFRLARTLNNLARALQYGGETAAAERTFLEALALDRKLGEPEDALVVLGNLAALALGAGRTARRSTGYRKRRRCSTLTPGRVGRASSAGCSRSTGRSPTSGSAPFARRSRCSTRSPVESTPIRGGRRRSPSTAASCCAIWAMRRRPSAGSPPRSSSSSGSVPAPRSPMPG